jgi:transposase
MPECRDHGPGSLTTTRGGELTYIGIDAHKRDCHITEMTTEGTVLRKYRIPTSEHALKTTAAAWPKEAWVAIESSTTGKWVYRYLAAQKVNVALADPIKVSRMRGWNKKTDEEDSYLLADLLRMNRLPRVHAYAEETDRIRALVHYRATLGQKIAAAKNASHAVLSLNGIRFHGTDLFGRGGLHFLSRLTDKDLPHEARFVLQAHLHEIQFLTQQAQQVQAELARIGTGDEDVQRLMTIPGFDYYSALIVATEIEDIHRFPSAKKLVGWSGLAPRIHQSGETTKRGPISKAGPALLRWVLIQAAHAGVKKDGKLKRFNATLGKRIGKGKAIVATARKLLVIVYQLLAKGKEYEDRDDDLTAKKLRRMKRVAKPLPAPDLPNAVQPLLDPRAARLLRSGGG